ncbi:hypothetical protein BD414DRAFT_479197 [Trametes punicea]|nr:hypothetical protein BD414DRAFT_479197 [Trametes punicea]
MLKRRRSSSTFIPDSSYIGSAPEPAIDAFERVAKRRRPFASLRRQHAAQETSSRTEDDTDGEEDVEGEESYTDQLEPVDEERRLRQTGDYRSVNSLLHDLHAEQRHRMLFSSPHPLQLSMLHHSHPVLLDSASSSIDKAVHVISADSKTPSVHHEGHKSFSPSSFTIPSRETSVVDHVEVRRVTERYEDMNRYLGSLFLSRRRQSDTPGQSNPT